MSSTRKAQDDSVYHPCRYASSPEFERGLPGNLVARRVALLDRREDRELIWAVHFLSHQEGGLGLVARELLANYPQHVGTPAMLAIGKSGGQVFMVSEIAAITAQIPKCSRFALLGEAAVARECRITLMYKRRELSELKQLFYSDEGRHDTRQKITALSDEIADMERQNEKAETNPPRFTAGDLQQLCIEAGAELPEVLADLCLKPSRDLNSVAPWYFSGLVTALREYISSWSADRTNFPETSLGRIVAEEFDYTWHGRCLSLLSGEARRGKSFAAKNCCLKNIGRARFVEVPPGNDDTSFFRALARGLGLGNFLRYKAIDIRERVESVLLSGDLLLVLDEAQRLWPECWQRYARPARINWLMMMVNAKVPVLLISTPQFLTGQRVAEKTGWNSAQLTGRISNPKILPEKLSVADLMAICRFSLPECGDDVLKQLANYALVSDRYLSAIEAVAMRSRYIASRDGRSNCTTRDVFQALSENIIPSDNLLNKALEKSRAKTPRPAKLDLVQAPHRSTTPHTDGTEQVEPDLTINTPRRRLDAKEAHV